MPEPFEAFLADLRDIHLSGAGAEGTCFYGYEAVKADTYPWGEPAQGE